MLSFMGRNIAKIMKLYKQIKKPMPPLRGASCHALSCRIYFSIFNVCRYVVAKDTNHVVTTTANDISVEDPVSSTG